MKINPERFKKDFAELKQFGLLENGGVTRVSFSEEDMAARAWLEKAMEDAGLEVSIDAFGNMRGCRAGTEDLPAVMVGSHIDTVPEGGHYDGVIGVLSALEIVRTLNDGNVKTRRPVEVVNFSSEESSRFGVATLGSKAMEGKLNLALLNKLKDKNGISLYEALKGCGYDADHIESAKVDPKSIYAFLEMHIEQGPVLEAKKYPVGIVTSIAAPTRFKVTIKGLADHSGNTPMGMRKDALAGASELVLGVERIASSEAGEKTVGTVGYLYVTPGAMNVVPGKVELGIDIRDVSMEDKNKAVQAVKDLIADIAERRHLDIEYEQLCNDEPVALSDRVISTLQETADEMGISYLSMPSGAGHDAMNMAHFTEVGMIFVPSAKGISHNIEEHTSMDEVCFGADLLLKATIKLAGE
ncbi:amidase, hydantoinase/carbamoylase family [Denitrovibrio acetiphilus DSM 12809]|uniref:Amidase, hydantoinase/carbamoylase family n=1 Tax=Denitrovibrio acetiphilus (strain DSM 12809 / NBRC 114555 / N2460) TaxID=522772 RepID=D4H1R4_DENA2|nr:Zn-dependent hydrolase [Denitrovibrio acetiphilus]ADD68824.1 amidase, hydantoinase/carbamoylase family [Denitrovibrio acetiphilus DSM 12809]